MHRRGWLCLAILTIHACARDRARPISSDPTPTGPLPSPAPPPVPPPPNEPIVVDAKVSASKPPTVELEIRNVSDAPIDLEDQLLVEVERPAGTWTKVYDIYDTIAPTCTGLIYGRPKAPRPCQHVTPGMTLKPPPWLGYSCSSQCIGTCRGNSDHPKGHYRFIVTTCDDAAKKVYASAPIDWPGAYP